MGTFVLEQNPPKQGLKHKGCNPWDCLCYGFRAKSTKTRIETSIRQVSQLLNVSRFRAKSTKTRIETDGVRIVNV